MKFFAKRGAKTSPRHARLSMLKIRRAGLATAGAISVLALVGYGWAHQSFSNIYNRAYDSVVAATIRAGFKVDQVLVTGRKNTDVQELLARVGVKKGDPIFGLSVAASQDALREIPWVKEVSVSRQLPGKVLVDLQERTPTALWQYNKKIFLIDEEGATLSSSIPEEYKDLPLLVGEDAPQSVSHVLSLLKAEPDIARQFSAAVRIGGRRWDLRLKSGATIRLPEENAELALRRLSLYQEKGGLLDKSLSAIDLRLPDRIVIEPGTAPQVADNKDKKSST